MGRTTCWTCGNPYEGLTCPVCAVTKATERQTEELQRIHEAQQEASSKHARQIPDAMADAAFRGEMAAAEQAAAVTKAISEEWRLQSRAKSEKAFELYYAGLHLEASQLAEEAIKQDPSNLGAYLAAGRCGTGTGYKDEARPYFQRAIALLATQEYNSPEPYSIVLSFLPKDDDELVRNWSVQLGQNYQCWKWPFSWEPILERLIKLDLKEDARQYVKYVAHKSPSLRLAAYSVDLGDVREATTQLDLYMCGFGADNSSQLLDEFCRIVETREISTEAVATLRNVIKEKYKQLEPRIREKEETRVRTSAREQSSRGSGPAVIGWIVGFFTYIFVYSSLGRRPGVWIALFSAIGAGIFVSIAIRHFKADTIYSREIAGEIEARERRWNQALEA